MSAKKMMNNVGFYFVCLLIDIMPICTKNNTIFKRNIFFDLNIVNEFVTRQHPIISYHIQI